MDKKKSLYMTIYSDIINNITSNQYKIGDRIPSETEMEVYYKTSKTPVRQALRQLEMEGWIHRVQGIGSFVSNFKPMGEWTLMTGFSQKYKEEWGKISARTIELTEIDPPSFCNQLLNSNNRKVIHLKRVRYFNNTPIIFIKHFVSPDFSIDIFKNDYSFISIDQLLQDKKKVTFSEITEEIEAVSVNEDEEVKKVLNISKDKPILKSTRKSFSNNFKLLDITEMFLDTQKWGYKINFNNNYR